MNYLDLSYRVSYIKLTVVITFTLLLIDDGRTSYMYDCSMQCFCRVNYVQYEAETGMLSTCAE